MPDSERDLSRRDVPDPWDGPDERVDALRAVLRTNGVGGAAPFTIEGEIQQFGHVASGVRRGGWRRYTAYAVAAFTLVVVAVGAVGSAVAIF